MTKKKKSPKQQPSEEIQMASNPDINVNIGVQLKYISEKINEYGSNHMFQLLGESFLNELFELEDMKKPIWEYSGKYDLKINAVKVKELPVEACFKQDNPYIIDITFSKYDFQKWRADYRL